MDNITTVGILVEIVQNRLKLALEIMRSTGRWLKVCLKVV